MYNSSDQRSLQLRSSPPNYWLSCKRTLLMVAGGNYTCSVLPWNGPPNCAVNGETCGWTSIKPNHIRVIYFVPGNKSQGNSSGEDSDGTVGPWLEQMQPSFVFPCTLVANSVLSSHSVLLGLFSSFASTSFISLFVVQLYFSFYSLQSGQLASSQPSLG